MGPWKSNIHVIRLPGGEKRREPKKVLQQIMVENFPRACKRHTHTFSRSWITIRITQRNLHSYENWKQKVWKQPEKMTPYFWGETIWRTADLSSKTMEARWEWCDIFQVLEENAYQQGIVFSGQIYFRKKGDIARWRETKRITFQLTYLKRMARGILLKKKIQNNCKLW